MYFCRPARDPWRRFEPLLVPWVHYVPVSNSLHNLSAAVLWVRGQPARARAIAEQGAKLAAEVHATPSLVAYTAALLRGYASLEQALLPLGEWQARFSCSQRAGAAVDCHFTGRNGTRSKSLREAVMPKRDAFESRTRDCGFARMQ